jgi:hypothetical protein
MQLGSEPRTSYYKKITMKYLFLGILSLCLNKIYCQCDETEIFNLRKTAIIFGEKDYKTVGALNNTLNDATDLSDSLKKIGFDVFTYQNADLKTMTSVIDNWYSRLSQYDVALFYFSGHGIEISGENYLIPIDADLKGESDVVWQGYPAKKIIDRLDISTTRFNICILDACRSNPWAKSWSRTVGSKGLAAMSGRGTFIGFAASPGMIASDGKNRNGVYTEGILRFITVPNLTIDQIFTKVNSHVRNQTSEMQIPFKNSSLSTDYCFIVKRTISSNLPNRQNTLNSHRSLISLSRNEDYILTIDSSIEKATFREANTLSTIATINLPKKASIHSLLRFSSSSYLLDTSNNAIYVVDPKTRSISKTIYLHQKPTSFMINAEETFAFVSVKSEIGKPGILRISLNNSKVPEKWYSVQSAVDLALSKNENFIYVISNILPSRYLLSTIDLKKNRVVDTISYAGGANSVMLSPDDDIMYIAATVNDKCWINVVELRTFKNIANIPVVAKYFTFTEDKKHLLISGNNEIAIIKVSESSVINRLPFATSPKGLTIARDGVAFVWLSMENRIFTFNVNMHLQNSIGRDPESNLIQFKEYLSKKQINKDYFATKELYNSVNANLRATVKELCSEIGSNFESERSGITIRLVKPGIGFNDNSDGSNFDFRKLTLGEEYGIYDKLNSSKRIFPFYQIKLKGEFLLLTFIEDRQSGTEETFTTPLNNINWQELKKFVRQYFLVRLDKLK